MPLDSKTYEAADFAAVQELYHSNGWTDGLPIVPPTEEAVQACLDWAMMPADQLIGVEPVRGLAITAEKIAINTVMAGCLPMHFPVVLTAWTAMMQEPFLLHGATASTGGCAIMVVLNGPIRREIGACATFNALGNSDRATSVIGRAIRLCLINLLNARPGEIDRSTLGHPGKFSFCIAEDEEDTTWKSLSEQRGLEREASAVTVMAAGAPRQIMNEWTTKPEEILETFAADMRANLRHYSIHPGNYALIIPKQLREHLQAAKWSKTDIANFIHERARIHRREWAEVGKGAVVREKGDRVYPALASPDHLLVIAAGGPAGGFGAVIPPWLGNKSRAVTLPIGACVDAGADEVEAKEIEESVMTIRVLDPTAGEAAATGKLAPRLPTLKGKTVGFISNGKEGTKGFFAHLDRILREEHGVAEVVSRTKTNYSAPADKHIADEIGQWDAVISGIGD
jgi:hypothetical protein